MTSPAVEAVIFDMDGVLVDSEPYWRSVEAELFDELGVDIRPYLARRLAMGMRVDEAVVTFCALSGLTGVDEHELAGRIVAGIVAAIRDRASLLPGAEDALERCAQWGIGVALASGSTEPVIDAVLDRFDLRGRFDVVCSAADDALGKPHPAIFLRAAALLDVPASHCVVIEDSINGCIAAKAARMRVLAVPHADDAGDPRLAIADLVTSSLEEFGSQPVAELFGLSSGRSTPARS